MSNKFLTLALIPFLLTLAACNHAENQAKLAAIKAACGSDFDEVYIGMDEQRMIQCGFPHSVLQGGEVALVRESVTSEGKVRIYSMPDRSVGYIKTINGKVAGWSYR